MGLLCDSARYRCTYLNPGFAMAKASFEKKKQNLFTRELDLNLRNKLGKCCNCVIAFLGAETWTLREVDHNYPENVEMWGWRRTKKISCSERVKNENVLQRVKEGRNILHFVKRRKADWICGILRMNWICGLLRMNCICGILRMNWICGILRMNWICDILRMNWICGILHMNWILEQDIEGNIGRKNDGKTRKRM